METKVLGQHLRCKKVKQISGQFPSPIPFLSASTSPLLCIPRTFLVITTYNELLHFQVRGYSQSLPSSLKTTPKLDPNCIISVV